MDFFGKTGMLTSRFAERLCFGIELQADFSGLDFFLAYLLKRTLLSKSVLVLLGLENIDDSTTKQHYVTHTLKKHTHTGASEGENQQHSDSCPPVQA